MAQVRVLTDDEKRLLNSESGIHNALAVGSNLQEMQKAINAGGGGGASAFTDLSDVPASYTGQAGKIVKVNPGATGLEFATEAGGGVVSEIVFDPDIGATAGNRFKTWGEVMTAIAAIPVSGTLVVNKSGFFGVASVPAGTYDLSKMDIVAAPGSVLPYLSFADGSTLSAMPRSVNGLTLINNNTSAPLYTCSAFALLAIVDGGLKNSATATQPFIYVSIGAQCSIAIRSQVAPLYSDSPGSEVVEVQGTLNIDITRLPSGAFMTQNDVFTNQNSGNGTINIAFFFLLPGGYTATHANFDNNLNVVQKEELRVSELITAAIDTALPLDLLRQVRSGLTLAVGATDYLSLGNKPGFSPTVDYVPADEVWFYEVEVMAYYRSTPNAAPVTGYKKFLITFEHDSGTGIVTSSIAQIGSVGALTFNVTAPGAAAPYSPVVYIENTDSHQIAAQISFVRTKNAIAFPASHT
jgi:hypothetical protein